MPDPVDFIVTAILDVDRESSPERTRRVKRLFASFTLRAFKGKLK